MFWNRHSTEERVDLNEEEEKRKKVKVVDEETHDSQVTADSSEVSVRLEIQGVLTFTFEVVKNLFFEIC